MRPHRFEFRFTDHAPQERITMILVGFDVLGELTTDGDTYTCTTTRDAKAERARDALAYDEEEGVLKWRELPSFSPWLRRRR